MQPPIVDTDKTEQLWELVEQSGNDVRPEEREQFFALLLENADIFAASKSDLSRTTKLQHSINTGVAPPIRQPVCRLQERRCRSS
jgi:hypothetical protein